ncbi:MAG: DMT family transporter [Ignavibacteriae bacterium]|nr:DMT family transporter [Ignavibacteriota bacterium]MCB9207971.1 DMT family transporter [Ignavibacteriales bacterium]MCB9258740.1 DMT family transporter [Ignavibacteriales bacterium]
MPYIGEISALITALLWAGTAIVFTEATKIVGSYVVNITRLILATIYLIFTILIFNLNYQISWEQIYLLGLSGIIGLVFGDGFLFKSFQYIGARLSMLVMTLSPTIAALLAYFYLGEELSVWGILGITITISGISIVVFKRSEQPSDDYKKNNLGYLFAFLGAIGQAINLIFAKEAFQIGEINGFVATFYRMVPSVPFMYLIGFLYRKKRNSLFILKQKKDALNFILIGSFIGPFLGITFSLIAVAYTYVGIASTLMSTVPILMLPIVKYYYKEKLSLIAIIGAFVAVVGIAILFLK